MAGFAFAVAARRRGAAGRWADDVADASRDRCRTPVPRPRSGARRLSASPASRRAAAGCLAFADEPDVLRTGERPPAAAGRRPVPGGVRVLCQGLAPRSCGTARASVETSGRAVRCFISTSPTVSPSNGHVPGEHLVEDHAHGVDVDRLVVLARADLGGHVVAGADALGVLAALAGGDQLGQAVVADLDDALFHEQVGRLEVAVHDAVVVQVGHPLDQALEPGADLGERQAVGILLEHAWPGSGRPRIP